MFEKITRENWLFYAIKNYESPSLDSQTEFNEDIKRFKYLKRLFRKWKTTGELKTRLIINHIIVLQNVFGVDACCTLLLFKIEKEFWSVLKTFLVYLKYVQDEELKSVKINKTILKSIQELKWEER